MPDLTKYREQLAETLAAHQSEQLWKPGGWAGDTACTCGWRMAMWSRKDFPETHRKHLADGLLASPVVAQMLAEARAEAWDEGRAVERMHARRVADYHHWSSISATPPADVENPYREPRA